jgi:hypothetical protein
MLSRYCVDHLLRAFNLAKSDIDPDIFQNVWDLTEQRVDVLQSG